MPQIKLTCSVMNTMIVATGNRTGKIPGASVTMDSLLREDEIHCKDDPRGEQEFTVGCSAVEVAFQALAETKEEIAQRKRELESRGRSLTQLSREFIPQIIQAQSVLKPYAERCEKIGF